MSHKLHLIRKTSKVKVGKNIFAENLHDNPFLMPFFAPLIYMRNRIHPNLIKVSSHKEIA